MSSGGKRLRPILLLLCGSIMKEAGCTTVKAAAAAELIHTASLIHDDIIDEAVRRRGRASLNARWGSSLAVQAGDFLFARAFRLIALCDNSSLNLIFSRAISSMCEGEMEQVDNAFNLHLTERQYMRYIYRKTAVLIEACCGTGARLAGTGESSVEALRLYGLNLGMAFQIKDDVLDIAGEPYLTGKPLVSDLREGVITLPLIYILQDPQWGPALRRVVTRRDFSAAGLEFLQQLSCADGPLKRALERASFYAQEARECLAGLERNAVTETLTELAGYALHRQK